MPEISPPDSMIPTLDEEMDDQEGPSIPFIDNEQNQEPDTPSIIAEIPGIELPDGMGGGPDGFELPDGIDLPQVDPTNPGNDVIDISQNCENISSGEGSTSVECRSEDIINQGNPEDIPDNVPGLDNIPSNNGGQDLEIPGLDNIPTGDPGSDSNINSNEQSCESSITGSGSETCNNSSG